MVLNVEDITGFGFLIWLVLTGLFYLVLYMAVLNIADDKLGNSPLKIPVLLALSGPSAFLMAMFDYNPMILFFLMVGSNYFRIRKQKQLRNSDTPVNKPLSSIASFGYLIALYGIAAWLQQPVDFDGMMKPLWKTWIPEAPE